MNQSIGDQHDVFVTPAWLSEALARSAASSTITPPLMAKPYVGSWNLTVGSLVDTLMFSSTAGDNSSTCIDLSDGRKAGCRLQNRRCRCKWYEDCFTTRLQQAGLVKDFGACSRAVSGLVIISMTLFLLLLAIVVLLRLYFQLVEADTERRQRKIMVRRARDETAAGSSAAAATAQNESPN